MQLKKRCWQIEIGFLIWWIKGEVYMLVNVNKIVAEVEDNELDVDSENIVAVTGLSLEEKDWISVEQLVKERRERLLTD